MDVGVQTRRVDADARSSWARFASDHARHSGIEPATIWDFNGLRGIAVAAVVLYHFAPALLPGGFVGVDIFFVVSAFLIGGILWRELAATGSIQFSTFFLRWLRRLAPTYFVSAAVTTNMINSGTIFLSDVFSPLFAAPASQPPQLEPRLHER